MAEELRINVDVGIADSARNLQNVREGLRDVRKEAGDLAKDVGTAETAVDKLGDAAKGVAGEAGKAADAIGDMGDQAKGAAQDTDKFGNAAAGAGHQAKKAAENVTEAGKKMDETGDKARRAGEKMSDAGDKAARGGEKIKRSSDEAAKSTTMLEGAATKAQAAFANWATATFGVAAIARIIAEMRENAEKTVAAMNKLGQEQFGIDRAFQDIVDNLGFGGGDDARLRARKLAMGFVAKTGVTNDQAAQILAGAQGAGFRVADANRPETDGTLGGYGVATEVAKFAARTRLDPDTAGQLFKIMQQEGVRSGDDALKVLAQIEQGQNKTAITSPSDFTRAFVRLAAGREKGQLPEVVGMLAGAAINDPSAERAATKVEQFYRAAQGVPSKVGDLAMMARDAGVLSQDAINAQMTPSDKAADFAARKADIESDHADRTVSISRRRADLKSDRDRLALDESDWAREQQERSFLNKPAAERESIRAKREQDLANRRRKIANEAADIDRDAAKSQIDYQNAMRNLGEDATKDEKSRMMDAAGKAYQQLDRSTRERFLRSILAGKSDTERTAILNRITEGGELPMEVSKITGAAGLAAFGEASAAAASATPGDTRARNEQYLANNAIAQKARAEAAMAVAGADQSGVQTASVIDDMAQKDVDLLRAAKEGGWDVWANYGGDRGKELRRGSDAELKAVRKAMITAAQFSKLVRGLPKETRRKLDPEIKRLWQEMYQRAYNVRRGSLSSGFGLGDASGAMTESAADMAVEFGKFVEKASVIASQEGEALPDFQTTGAGADIPQLENLFGEQDPFAPAKPATPKPEGEEKPVSVSYNVTIGTYVGSRGGDLDLPGRLDS